MLTTEELIARLDAQFTDIKAQVGKNDGKVDTLGESVAELKQRALDLEQKMARRGGSSEPINASLGSIVAASEELKEFRQRNFTGTVRIPIKAALTTGNVSVAPDRQPDIIAKPRQRLTIRELLAPGQTSSNLVQFMKQTGRTNNADVVSETTQKPESSVTYTLEEAPVRTIATWIPASRQVMDDVPQLQSVIDTELRYMIGLKEEEELLYGDGTGEHIHGLIPQATAYSAPFSVDDQTMLDVILLAIAQAQESQIMATGVILNSLDWKKMQSIKDEQGRYIGGGPFAQIGNSIWSLPVVDTPALAEGEFMVGGFNIAAQIIDRMTTEVMISSEDRDNFIKNMLTIRAEERVALAVKIPEAIVYGEYGVVSG